MRIVHIIPTFNEKDNIKRMIESINKTSMKFPRWENIILVVDDFSPDGTSQVVQTLKKNYKNLHLLQKKKEGLGKALILGYEFAVKKLKADIVLPNDADFQWNPDDFPKLVKKIEEGYDVSVASRHIRGGKVIGWNWFRKLNHDVSNVLLAWFLAGVHEVKDHAGNFKAIRVKKVLDRVNLKKMQNAGFSFQLHILYELSKYTDKFVEVPVLFRERKFGKSKIGLNKYYLRDIFEYVRSSIQIRLERSRTFFRYVVVGGVGFTIQTIISKFLIMFSIRPEISVSVGAEGAIISNFIMNNYWTFSTHKIKTNVMLNKFIQFNFVSLGAIVIQAFVVGIGVFLFGQGAWFLSMVFSIIFLVIPYSFIMYNRFIWKTHSKK